MNSMEGNLEDTLGWLGLWEHIQLVGGAITYIGTAPEQANPMIGFSCHIHQMDQHPDLDYP